MRLQPWLAAAAVALLVVPWAGAEEIAGLPLHSQKLDDGVIRLWLGDSISSTAVVAFATAKGIVVVDTFGVPEVDARLRDVIAREFGRSDFAILINTHEHTDHTGGNSIYADCTIVGHELIAAGLEKAAANRQRTLEWYPGRIADIESEIAALDADSTESARLNEDLILNRLYLSALQADPAPVPPTLTFSDRMTLDQGDTTFELSFIGGMHSASDIAVFVPERGLLLTGDTMADVWLTDSPGCLASFSVREDIPHDFPLLLANWDRLLDRQEQIETLLPGHWNGELSIAGAEARVEYVRALWNGVQQAAETGKSLTDVQAEYQLEARFPELVSSPGFTPQRHYASISEMWHEVTGQTSAARAIFTVLADDGDESVIAAILADRDDESPTYLFSEAEFNAYGYALLQQRKVDGAIRMFRISVEFFPESWNVYDSLGEALLAAGQTDEAAEMYEKSIFLNPDNTNGKDVLDRIRTTPAAADQTQES